MALNKKQYFFFAGITFILFLFLVGFYFYLLTTSFKRIEPATVSINKHIIKVDLATNPESQYKGLSNRQFLCPDCGMLFIFPQKDIREFVMRDMNFPLDILFIADNKILNIAEKLKPENSADLTIYESITTADMVLELNSGYSVKNNIKVGDQIVVNYNK